MGLPDSEIANMPKKLLAGLIPAFPMNDSNIQPNAAADRDQLLLSLQRLDDDIQRFWPLARSVETQIQAWRWTGYPGIPGCAFPFSLDLTQAESWKDPAFTSWEKIAFNGRGADDVDRVRNTVSLYDSAPGPFQRRHFGRPAHDLQSVCPARLQPLPGH